MEKSIKYGEYYNNNWNTIKGLEDPLFKEWYTRVKEYLSGYELWIYGGVLEGWETTDIDGSILGPLDPDHINWMLANIVRVSFELGVFPDIKYSIDNKLFNWSQYMKTQETVECQYSYYRPYMEINGKLVEWGSLKNYMWCANRIWPMNKAIRRNHEYKDPIIMI